MDSGSKRAHSNGNALRHTGILSHRTRSGTHWRNRHRPAYVPGHVTWEWRAAAPLPSLRGNQTLMVTSSRNWRRRILPTLVLGNSVRNSTFLGRL